MSDNKALLHAFRAISRLERREREKAALRLVKAAGRAGLSVQMASIEGVELTFGAQDQAEPPEAATANPWDRVFNAQEQKRAS
jgi:hypothetical protein